MDEILMMELVLNNLAAGLCIFFILLRVQKNCIHIIKITGRNQVFAFFCDSLCVYNHYNPSKKSLKKNL